MKVLVTGSNGQLGKACVTALDGEHQVIAIDIDEADLTQPIQVENLFEKHEINWVVHCAAWTDVDGAEVHKDESMAANAKATNFLVEQCKKHNAGITMISTDYVFDGRNRDGYLEDHERNPINWYGKTKLRAESAVFGYGQIVRTSWLFGEGNNFVRTMLKLMRKNDSLKVVSDQVGSPTYCADLAEVIKFLIEDGTAGIYHATNSGSCSWYEFACEIASIINFDANNINPCSSGQYPTKAKRPACSVLKSSYLEKLGCPDRPSWQDAVKRYIDAISQE